MKTTLRNLGLALLLAFAVSSSAATSQAAETYKVDPVHSSVSFMIQHQGISDIHGRFNDYSGTFVIDTADPAKSSFSLSVVVDSVDTNNEKRDEHLRAPDYFNSKQFPALTFQSTKVKGIKGGYEVTGDLTIHGVTKQVNMTLKGGDKAVEFPKGKMRVGVTSTLTIKRSEYGMTTALGGLGDDVKIIVGLEAAKE